jgi:hypothetical protein
VRSYESFVIGSDEGPIDWDGTTLQVVGGEEFREEVKNKMTTRKILDDEITDLVEFASTQLSIDRRMLLKPRGWKERRARHDAFSLLVNEYGVSVREVAKVGGVSPPAVLKALKK